MNRTWSTEEAYAFCLARAGEHYENFPVASRLLPRAMRRHIAAIYAFARAADDMADEGEAPASERLVSLALWREKLERAARGEAEGPVFTALAATLRETSIPLSLLGDLLTAFAHDARNLGYADDAELLDYCRHSAVPIGRLVLHLYDDASPDNLHLSDQVCTGLQLANFWQDLSVDVPRERITIPRATMERHGYTLEDLESGIANDAFRAMMTELLAMAETRLREGAALPRHVRSLRLRLELKGTIAGGLRIVAKTRRLGDEILRVRPTIGRGDLPAIVIDLIRPAHAMMR